MAKTTSKPKNKPRGRARKNALAGRTPVLDNDPNITFAKRTYRVTLGEWLYRYVFEMTIGGNCADLPDSDSIWDSLLTKLVGPDESPHVVNILMTDADGNTLDCEVDDVEFRRLVIAVELVKIEPEKKSE